MGFSPQPTDWQCGPYALQYALLALAIPCDAAALTRASGATEQGADERDLDRAARRYGCVLSGERWAAADDARTALRAHLSRRTPVLLCVDQWNHWIVAVGADGDAVIVFDSRQADVVQIVDWNGLLARVVYRAAFGATLYDLHPLVPRRVPTARAEFSRARAEFLRRPSSRALRCSWEHYVRALVPLARPPGPQAEWTVLLGNVVREYTPRVLADSTAAERGPLRAHLRHAAFVADTYALEVGPDQTALALAAVRGLANALLRAA
jgi:hypothetical protein